MKIKVGETYKVSDNLEEELKKLGIQNAEIFADDWTGEQVKVHHVWPDKTTDQEYATVDLCVEIPIQCLKAVE